MSEATYIEIPGSGRVRVTTPADLEAAQERSQAMTVIPLGRMTLARPRALTASADRAENSPGTLLRLDQQWQREAMRIYRTVGECWNPAQYYSRAMERIRYFPAMRNERGVPQEVKSGKLVDVFNRIQSPGGAPGDLSEIAGQYARLQFVIGDGLLTNSQEDGEEVFEYLSPMEMRLNPRSSNSDKQEYRRYRAPGAPPEELTEAPDDGFEPLTGDDVHVWRLHRRHPEFSQWADSPVRPVIDLYTLLNHLTLAVAAEALSRAAQRGMLFLPSEFSISVDKTQAENPDEDPLVREFTESMQRSISNPGTAEAMSPYILRAPGVTNVGGGSIPTAELIKWIQLGPGDRYTEGEMWDKTISRIAGSIDMPKELMTGVGDVSHWGQWFLDDIGFRQHTGPTVIRFCNDIASAYLRPAARDEGIENADQVTMWFDASQAVNHPDETGVALKAHDQILISDAAAREKLGFPDSAAPSAEEYKTRVEIKLKEDPFTGQPAPGGQTTPQDGGRGGDVVQQPPQDSQKRPPGAKPPSPQGPNLAAMMLGAAEMQVARGRELVGKRLWRRAQSCDECQDRAREVKASLIAFTLGPDMVRSIIDGYVTEARLVEGIGEPFAERVREWGVNNGWPEQLGKMVEQHLLRTMYEEKPPPLPSGFEAACLKALQSEVSDGA